MKTAFLLSFISPALHETLVIAKPNLIIIPTGSYISIADVMYEVSYTEFDPTSEQASVHCRPFITNAEEALELVRLARVAGWLPMSEFMESQT